MKEIKIDIGFDHVDTIFHMADIHIRNLKRHQEYREVFERTYAKIRELNTHNSIIYIGGDIVHAKTQMSPELIQMTSDFFRNLADIAPTIIITGNHDVNLNNANRLDALSPIIENLNHEQLHYLKDSGVYHMADVSFAVMGIFDKPNTYIKSKDFESKTKIALFHGAINASKTDFGYTLPSKMKNVVFKGYDMVMLGDIHKMQTLQEHNVEKLEIDESDLARYLKNGWVIDN